MPFGVCGYSEFIILARHSLRSRRHSDGFDGAMAMQKPAPVPASSGYPN
jgi:hypothetical protein